jgi:hypothetical protein
MGGGLIPGACIRKVPLTQQLYEGGTSQLFEDGLDTSQTCLKLTITGVVDRIDCFGLVCNVLIIHSHRHGIIHYKACETGWSCGSDALA